MFLMGGKVIFLFSSLALVMYIDPTRGQSPTNIFTATARFCLNSTKSCLTLRFCNVILTAPGDTSSSSVPRDVCIGGNATVAIDFTSTVPTLDIAFDNFNSTTIPDSETGCMCSACSCLNNTPTNVITNPKIIRGTAGTCALLAPSDSCTLVKLCDLSNSVFGASTDMIDFPEVCISNGDANFNITSPEDGIGLLSVTLTNFIPQTLMTGEECPCDCPVCRSIPSNSATTPIPCPSTKESTGCWKSKSHQSTTPKSSLLDSVFMAF